MAEHDADSSLERAGQRLAALSAVRGLWATVGGIALVVIAFAALSGNTWFVPVLVIGVVLIAAGILGPRIRGRVSLEFGLGGATLDLQLHVAPPGQVGRLPRRAPLAAATPASSAAPAPVPAVPVIDALEPAPTYEPHHDPAMMAVRAAQAADAVAAAVARADRNGQAPATADAAAQDPGAART